MKSKKQIIWLIVLTILFYVTGRLGYQHIYRLTIDTVQLFANGKIGFFGKFPFWLLGDPRFGLIFGSIPLTIFLTLKLFLRGSDYKFSGTILVYILCFITSYFFFCFLQNIQLTASNDFIKDGEMFRYRIGDVDLNEIFLLTIFTATILTYITLFVVKWVSKRRNLTSF